MILLAVVLCAAAAAAASEPCVPHRSPAPGNGTTCFWVWAPGASSVAVEVQGQGLSPMEARAGGWWSARLGDAGPGAAYRFLLDGSLARLDPQCQASAGNWSLVHQPLFNWTDASFRPAARRPVVLEVHVPSFTDAGTLDAAALRLEYVRSLGVTHVELMPVTLFRGGWTAWGYNPAGLYACIMNEIGGYAALKRFVNHAHSLGLAVVVDVVYSHTDGGGPAYNALYDFDGRGLASGNGIYFYEDAEAAETAWGPRLDYSNETVFATLVETARTLRDEYHMDGFRVDATVCIRRPGQSCWTNKHTLPDGWRFLQQLASLTPEFCVAEDDQGNSSLTLPVSAGGAGFSAQWAYKDFYYGFIADLTASNNSLVNISRVAMLLSTSTEGHRMLFTENHDMASTQNRGRVPNQVDPGGSPYKPSYWAAKKSMLGVAAVALGRGDTMLFQGQEFLTYAPFAFPVPPKLDWTLAKQNSGLVQEVRDLLHLDVGDSLSDAKVLQTSDSQKVVVLLRNDSLLCIFHMLEGHIKGYQLQNVPHDGTWNVVFNGDNSTYFPQYQGWGMDQSSVTITNGQGNVDVPEYSVVCLSLAMSR